MPGSNARKEIKVILKKARRAGYKVGRTGSGHWSVSSESGDSIILPFSPGSPSSIRDAQSHWRKFEKRNGCTIP